MRDQVRKPRGVRHIGFPTWNVTDMGRVEKPAFELVFQHVEVGSDRGAVPVSLPARFPGPPSEPGVPVSRAPGSPRADIDGLSDRYAAVIHGEGIVVPL